MKALFSFKSEVPASRVVADHRRALVPVGIVLAINLAVLMFIVMPMRRSAESGESQANASVVALNAAIADLKDAEAMRDGQKQAGTDLEKFYGEVLPANLSVARRLTMLKLAQLARSHDVALQRGAATTEELRNSPLERLGVNYSLEGSWNDVRQFIYEIETGPDFLVIDNVGLSEVEGGSAPLALQLEISTYYRAAGTDNVR
jgi:Tfp pilus assembly protein PilO